ncbi:intraflagellar transport protein 46 homolog isoform X2 [Cydia pomonella]|uniref:intraflagellar transport protein 46 homolog isoform X2 n=1 Tax=Cydia pomonella TaxID=82600 RepID=UPI002ADD5EAD|nr:intraflagellar transport protein 46 homolog isoform X2 [Cydia pomonella]
MLGSFCPRTRPGRFARERVAMAMRDKHCQTYHEESEVISDPVRVMYDETVEVNAREVDSPSSSDEEVVKAAMSKFNPPARHTARHDFDSESESDSDPENENFLNNIKRDASPERKPPEKAELSKQSSKDESVKGRSTSKRADSSENSESDSAELGLDRPLASGRKRMGVVIPAEGAYDPKQYQDLKVPADMENIFQYIMKYTPQKIDIEFKLQPFVPEYVPAVGDIDAFLKVTTPARGVRGEQLGEQFLEHIDNLGLMVLDEPAAEQSESALLHLQLRALSKTSAKPTMKDARHRHADGGVAGQRGARARRRGRPARRPGLLAGGVRGPGVRRVRHPGGGRVAGGARGGAAPAVRAVHARQELAAVRGAAERREGQRRLNH